MHIRSPIEWLFGQSEAATEIGAAHPAEYWSAGIPAAKPVLRKITTDDLRAALRLGLRDFAEARTDVAFLCLIYPILGLVIAAVDARGALLPLLFPTAAGFALIGPFAAIGLYEMSRRREITGKMNWMDVFQVIRSPSLPAIAGLGLLLIGVFLLWLVVADGIYNITLGPLPPASVAAFLAALFTTGAGWAMIILGFAAGGLFAVAVLALSVVSFPLLLDRPVSFGTAIATSLGAVRLNPGPMALWGGLVAAGLVLGSIPFFLGLVVVLPILGHATWHLYRKLVR